MAGYRAHHGLLARRPAPARRRLATVVALLAAAVVAAVVAEGGDGWPWTTAAAATAADDGAAAVAELFAGRRSGEMVEVEGAVQAVLADDVEGSRHQRFILTLAGGATLLVAHNIDLAPRVPLRRGDAVRVRGEHQWNERGGVVHWTHRDPAAHHPGGWVQHSGRTYR